MTIAYPDNTFNRNNITASGLSDSSTLFDVVVGGNEKKLSLAELKKTGVQVVNVLQYGADPTGATSSSAAIQAAIDSLPAEGGVVYFPSGTYLATGLTVGSDNVSIAGDKAVVKLPASGEYPIITPVSCDDLAISGLVFDGNRASSGTDDTFLIRASSCNRLSVMSCTFMNNKAGIRLSACPDSSIIGLTCSDFTMGQVTVKDGSSRTAICGLVANDNGSMDVALHVVDFEATSSDLTDCVLTSSTISCVGTSAQFTGDYVARCSITGNVFRNNDTSGNGNCVKSDDVGQGNSVKNNVMYFANNGVFDASVNHPLEISGNTLFQNSGATGTRHGIRMNTSRSVCKNNTISGAVNHGIYVGSGVDHCEISHNSLRLCGQDGINIESSTSNNNQVFCNDIDQSGRYGFRVDGSSNIVNRNTIRNGTGVYGAYCAGNDCVLLDNHLEGNTANYIRFGSTTGVVCRVTIASHANSLTAGSNVLMVSKKVSHSSAIPVAGSWLAGDTVFYTAPSAGGKVGAVCVTAGTPGTWKEFGAIDP